MKQSVTDSLLERRANAMAGMQGLLEWSCRYGHEMRVDLNCAHEKLQEMVGGGTRSIELAHVLSASFNLGFEDRSGEFFLMLDEEEFDFLSLLPIQAVVVGSSQLHILVEGIELGMVEDAAVHGIVDLGAFPPLVLSVQIDGAVWNRLRGVGSIVFGCLRYKDSGGYEVREEGSWSYPLMFAN